MQGNARTVTLLGFPIQIVSPTACFHCLNGAQGAADGARLLGRVALCADHALELTARYNAAIGLMRRRTREHFDRR